MVDQSAGGDDQGEQNKGRTVFGIGLPATVQASVQAASKAAARPAPMVPPAGRPRSNVHSEPARPPVDGVPGHEDTQEDVRAEIKREAKADHTIHALPNQLLHAVTGQQRGRAPVSEPDEQAPEVQRPADHAASASGSHQRPTRVQSQAPAPAAVEGLDPRFAVERPHVRLIAGKAIPGTRYRLLRWLGEGGMGVVYEAEHIDIERRVALKILRSELSERSDTAQVFREEAKAAARAGSKNNVEIFDFGELPDGRLFFCMELLSGTDLSTLTDQGLEPSRMFAILRQICKGLGAAHKAGIVHRDIKPENILLVEYEGRRDMVKIVDFGVAAMLNARQDDDGPIAGTPQYMAPEQIAGGDFDARLDIYAVGCVAYEMLVRHPPFTMDNLADVLLAQINVVPPRPSEVRADAGPASLEDVVMRCLEKQPDLRYANMAELEAALCEAQIAAGIITEWDDLPLPDVDPDVRASLLARMPGATNVVTPPRRKWLLPAVAVGSAALAVGVYQFIRAPEVPPEVAAQIEQLGQEARDAAALGHYVYTDEPDEDVALKKLLELEAIAGPGATQADKLGLVLRNEFSAQLLTVADKFWNLEATQPLAYDYYDWVLWFDPDNSLALERSARTARERNELRDRLITDKVSEAEKLGIKIASAAVAPKSNRSAKVAALNMKKMPLSKSLEVEAAMRGAGLVGPETEIGDAGDAGDATPTKPATGTPAGSAAVDPAPEDPPPDEPVPTEDVTPKKSGPKPTSVPTKKPAEAEDEPEAKRDPVKAKELAGQGTAALRAGRRSEAEALFNQAVSNDRRSAEALIGLSDIYFDSGSATKAARYAEQAVAVDGSNGSYRIKLGDAYYSMLRYHDALAQYEKAQQLGDGKAVQRIAKVKAKLGG